MILDSRLRALGAAHEQALFLTLLLCSMVANSAQSAQEFRIAFVGSTEGGAYLGVQQGLSEANLQGSFLGQIYALDVIAASEAGAERLKGHLTVVAAGDESLLDMLQRHAPSTPIFNVTLDGDGLRDACLPNVLHIVPSKRMKEDAERQWLKVHPQEPAKAAAWHPDFEKFAARDLNKRYRKAFGKPMDDQAWAGWAAVKMSSDSVARAGITEGAKLLEFLKTGLSFDGQKGVDMSFRETGQLRQTLLLIRDGKIAGEAPVRGVAEPDDLDSLGVQHCST